MDYSEIFSSDGKIEGEVKMLCVTVKIYSHMISVLICVLNICILYILVGGHDQHHIPSPT